MTVANVKPTGELIADAASAACLQPELLAPAGDWDCARAAVENGADAIYFGLERFNARIRAHNFSDADLPPLMEYLHRRGVRGYVAFNTLVFENEMPAAQEHLRTMIAAGVDAVLVQDVGVCRLIRQLSPDLPMHASTQMTITSACGVEFARGLGCSLVVLARECSLKEIERISQGVRDEGREPTDTPCQPSTLGTRRSSLPLEVFVHGALCVAYSGQCLTSEALGGRSANRGECAQACRMPYELLADGQPVSLGDRRYLLSPQDLAGLELLPDLIRAGVASLKIEGRLKTPEYVANITRIYRQALDELAQRRGLRIEGQRNAESSPLDTRPFAYEMEMAFSRGLHTGWLRGVNNQRLVHGRFGKKRGVYLGEVTNVLREALMVKLEGPLKPGDGVVFDAGRPEEREEGGRVYEVRNPQSRTPEPNLVELRFGRGDVDFARVNVGDRLWKTDDPELNRRLRRTFEGNAPKFRRPISIEIHGRTGLPLTVVARDELGNVSRVESKMPLAKAEKHTLTTEGLRTQFGRLGGTPFRLGKLANALTGAAMLPVSELNRLRRQLVDELQRLRAQPKRWTLTEHRPGGAKNRRTQPIVAGAESTRPARANQAARLVVLVRNLTQLDAALNSGVETIYCDFENPKKYRDAVQKFRGSRNEGQGRSEERRTEAGGQAVADEDSPSTLDTRHSSVFVAPPRIFKVGEEWTLEQVRSSNADGYLVRNYDHLKFFAGERCVGDYSFNVANRLAADYFKNRFGLERVTASYDLNFQQLEALLEAAPPDWFEVTIHQHMPMFHMEHCVFCAFLSAGTDYTNCGRPCDRHDVKLRDRVGAEHPVKADVGCRNTVFNARAQTGADFVSRMQARGVRHFRVEFLNESPAQVTQTIFKYRQLLRGEISGAQLWRELKLLSQLGVTRGQLAGQRT